MRRRLSSLPHVPSIMESSSKKNENGIPPTKKSHWSNGLLLSIDDPQLKVLEDDQVVVIKDKFPKAKFHYLVLPKIDIPSIMHVTKENRNLLEHMENVGQNISKKHNGYEFIIGYHAIPSMQRLHLHVISTDFNSTFLKKKQHWNSYTTPFFLPSYKVRNQIQEEGQLKVNSEIMRNHLKSDLKCHKCYYLAKNMPDLKKHLLEHIPNNNE